MSENEHTFLRTRFLEIDYCLFSILGKVFVQLYLGLDLHEREKNRNVMKSQSIITIYVLTFREQCW